MCVEVCVCMCVCVCVCMCVSMCVHMLVNACECVHVSACMHVCVCMCVVGAKKRAGQKRRKKNRCWRHKKVVQMHLNHTTQVTNFLWNMFPVSCSYHNV